MKTVLRDALDARGYSTLTDVQEAVLAPALDGRDLLVSARTGSGKTVAFGLAVAPQLLGSAGTFEKPGAPLGLVIAPTRELALQVQRELAWLLREAGVRIATAVGGTDGRDERRALARGAHVVVATPGRLVDHLNRGAIDLSALRAVVLDEADEMLDLGFREDLETILAAAPEDRRTLLFSATLPAPIVRLADRFQRDAARVEVGDRATAHADIAYRVAQVAERDVDAAVVNLLLDHDGQGAIVFANTRAAVARLSAHLSGRGFKVVTLSGELSQAERTGALAAMRDGRAEVCVATDVAARGIDLPGLEMVIHAELPSGHETLLHRSGRTGRAGRKGASVLVAPPKARRKAERLLREAKLHADWTTAPSAEAVAARHDARLWTDPVWTAEVDAGEAATVAALVAAHGPEALAAAVLRMHRAGGPAPEVLAPADAPAPKRERPAFGASVWVSIPGGRKAGAEPRRVLPALLKAGGLDKDDIGAIRVRPDRTDVQVRDGAIDALEAGYVGEMTRMDALPHDAAPRGAGPRGPKRKGPMPPRGKPSSKKNKARRAAGA
ncbi:DEAD/DEAH box helicase [Jannaschia sp. Os4]|uniref:DEAD/DEAH box helicase n=1 Tax=Jannaschia sp. Os4 TaxID=2807617 RepID=UPI0019393EB7|nr:DEAD/DEAH box helicase [Jannaschia sp. Os4]MBM2577780.1 DEAD/DEAH box helicase [Jannaschia sp. Os4]